ncbi:MAG: hypothetical protein KTR31_00525 [Myxococcales bacterium]|nr:hypothetical protein [Myxococcales bacterium]
MPITIDRVDTEIEVFRSADDTHHGAPSGGSDTLAALRGDKDLYDKLRPFVLKVVQDELKRIARKVGAP